MPGTVDPGEEGGGRPGFPKGTADSRGGTREGDDNREGQYTRLSDRWQNTPFSSRMEKN